MNVAIEGKDLKVAESLSIEQLVKYCFDFSNEISSIQFRDELVKRGKDNIQERISIKKLCKRSISEIEILLNTTNQTDKNESTKELKNRFLSLISIVDRLQLEWQKHDLGLKKN